MSASPMIIAVWIRAAAPGCRAMASTAPAVARPWPSPQRPDARPIPMPAAITANGPTQPPVPPSAANAIPGTDRTAHVISVRISEGRTTQPPCELCDRLVMLRFLDGAGDIEHGQHAEDEGLQERDQ